MNWRLGSQQKSEQYNKGLESITLPNCLCGDIQRDKLEEKLSISFEYFSFNRLFCYKDSLPRSSNVLHRNNIDLNAVLRIRNVTL